MSAKNFVAGAAVKGYRFVKFSGGKIIQSAAATDNIVGVSERIDVALDERIDVIQTDHCQIQIGAAVSEGDRLISDANGKAIPTAAITDVYGAIANADGAADGDIIEAVMALGSR